MLPSTSSPLLSYAVSTATPCAVMLRRSYISCVLRAGVQLPDELKHLRGEARSIICPPLRWCEHPWSPTFPSSINGATLIRELWNTRGDLCYLEWRDQDIHPGPLLVSVTLGLSASGSIFTVRTTGTSGSTCEIGSTSRSAIYVELLNTCASGSTCKIGSTCRSAKEYM